VIEDGQADKTAPAPVSDVVITTPAAPVLLDTTPPAKAEQQPPAPLTQAAPPAQAPPIEAPPVLPPVHEKATTPEKDVAPDVRDRYAELVDRALKKERLKYLRNLGINPVLSDDHILALSPDVDVETPDGKSTIDAWRTQGHNEKLFVKKDAVEIDIDSLTAGYKPATHNTFPKELMIKTLQRLAGK